MPKGNGSGVRVGRGGRGGHRVGLGPVAAGAQDGSPPAPANVRAVNGMNAGEVSVLWDAVDGAAFYRIGWVAYDDTGNGTR